MAQERFWAKIYQVMADFEWDQDTAYEYVSKKFPSLLTEDDDEEK